MSAALRLKRLMTEGRKVAEIVGSDGRPWINYVFFLCADISE